MKDSEKCEASGAFFRNGGVAFDEGEPSWQGPLSLGLSPPRPAALPLVPRLSPLPSHALSRALSQALSPIALSLTLFLSPSVSLSRAAVRTSYV